MIRKTYSLPCILLVICLQMGAFAQDFEETGLATDASITRTSNVRKRPSIKTSILKTLQPNTEVRVIDPTPVNGYLRVLFDNGEQGYVYRKNIDLHPDLSNVTGGIESVLADSPDGPCVTTGFENCPPRGCYAPNSTGALFNEAKRRPPVGTTAILLTFTDLQRMQDEVGARLGLRSQNKSLTAAERAQLGNIQISGGNVGESTLVSVVGFIPFGGTGLKGGSVETVNCKFTETHQRDIHIPLASQSSSTEFEGIVIEMIPQNRPSQWTLQKLRTVRKNKKKVMVTGGLFYDNEHLVNKNPARPLGGHSKRFTIWEIHPVTRFFVCTRADNSCNPGTMTGWTPLENFP